MSYEKEIILIKSINDTKKLEYIFHKSSYNYFICKCIIKRNPDINIDYDKLINNNYTSHSLLDELFYEIQYVKNSDGDLTNVQLVTLLFKSIYHTNNVTLIKNLLSYKEVILYDYIPKYKPKLNLTFYCFYYAGLSVSVYINKVFNLYYDLGKHFKNCIENFSLKSSPNIKVWKRLFSKYINFQKI